MQEFKGTPGPWVAYEQAEDNCFYLAQQDGAPYTPDYSDVAGLVCETWTGERYAIQKANAALLSAAAELLEALREADKTLCALQVNVADANKSEPRWDGVWDEIQKQRDAIKQATNKALGQTQQQR